MRITFAGAAGTVTGSCFFVETKGVKLLVDCGMFQGLPELEARNAEPFPFDPAEVDWLLLTHGHLDHLGLAASAFALARLAFSVWDAVNDPLFGYLSDRTRTPW
ncbi:MAG: MBL fold metallo-hydrolase, partial [Candidatus Bipolaricaulaceae bacterium]